MALCQCECLMMTLETLMARSSGRLVGWQSCHVPKFQFSVVQVSASASGHMKPLGVLLLPACPIDLCALMDLGRRVCASGEKLCGSSKTGN